MEKSPDAFRTISEVADALETPAHVLRFWESRFPQIKPVKRAGGRRYYRPADVALLGGIRHLLHDDGMTIRGVQKILREQGVRHVAAMAPGTDVSVFDVDDEDLMLDMPVSGEAPETGQILAMEPIARRVTSLPETTAEVVQFHAAPESDAPEALAEFHVAEFHVAEVDGAEVDRSGALVDLSDGFLLPTANRRPLPELDPEMPQQDVAEAGHVWVDDPEPEFDWTAQPLFPRQATSHALPDLTDAAFATDAAQPRDGEMDLLPEAVPAEFTLEPDQNPEDQVEAGDFVTTADFLERPDLSVAPGPVAAEEAPELAAARADAVPLNLAGIAARLRALPQPVLPDSGLGLVELQMRLGLLHAQMAEAVRARK